MTDLRAALEALRPLSDAVSPEPWVADGETSMLLIRHASVQTTIDRYAQDADAARRRASEALGRAHQRTKNGTT